MNQLIRLLAIRPGEGSLIALVAGLFATVEAGRGFGEIGADTLFLRRIGADFLPHVYIALGLISLVVAVMLGAAIGRFRRGPFLVSVLASLAAILVVLRLAMVTGAPVVFPIAWLTIYVEGAVLGTLVWTIAGSVFDARQAKRLFPLCTSAAIAGGFLGTLGAGPLARFAGVENLVLVDAGLLVATVALTARVSRAFNRGFGGASRARGPRTSFVAELRAGFDYVRDSPLMRLVAIAYVLFAILLFSVAFPFLRAAAAAFPSDADLATALGVLSAAVTGVSFLVSVGVANRIYTRFGITLAALALPVVYLAGFALWLIQFTLATAIAFRFAQQVTQRGLSNAAWSALYNVVPAERRAQVLAFNDGVPGQLGTALSGILLLLAGSLLAPSQVFWLGAAAALACTLVALWIRRRYAESLLRTLRGGLAEQVLEGGPGLVALARDPRVLGELRAATADPTPAVRRLAAQLLGRLGARQAIEEVAGLLDDPEPEVRCAALGAVAMLDGDHLSGHADRLTRDSSPIVRAELAVALVRVGDERRPHEILAALIDSASPAARVAGLDAVARLGGHAPSLRMAHALADQSPEVRAAAVGAIGAPSDDIGNPRAALVAALSDESRFVRTAAARALNGRAEASLADILEVLRTGSEPAQEAALVALEGHGEQVRGPLLEWALGQVERAALLRQRAMALAGAETDPAAADGASADFLRFLLGRRGWQIEDRVLGAVAILGAPEAGGLIRRCLRSDDAETRAQAIEALEALGDRRLGRALVDLIETDQPGRRPAARDVLRSLGDDPDPWVRALALRTLSEGLGHEWRIIVERATTDPDPIVRSAVEQANPTGGSLMPATVQGLGDMERMLFLRRVPLFSQMAPEDLQRVASTATERAYAPGEAIVREGELGQELVVIVEGSVKVFRGEGNDTRLVRSYGEGDHFGELAVLRERPRAATVVATEAGMRGLVIDGRALKAILHERPEAAMAMLATLAERISAQ